MISPIGIHIGYRHIGAAQLERRSGKPRLAAAALLPRAKPGEPFDDAEAARLRAVLDRRGFKGDLVTLAVPDDLLFSAMLDLPPRSSGAPVDQLASAELARQQRLEPAAVTVGTWDLPPPVRQREGAPVMAIGCEDGRAESILALFDAHDLEVIGLDARACALARACAPLLPSEGVTPIVELSFDAARLAIVVGGSVAYERSLPVAGLSRLHASIAENLEADDDTADYILTEIGLRERFDDERDTWELLSQARDLIRAWLDSLTRELALATSYALERYGQERAATILLVGAGAAIPAVGDELSRRVEAPCRAVLATDLCESPTTLLSPHAQPALITAIGLAARFDR